MPKNDQLLLPGTEMVRLTAGQYAYARVRGRMPRSKEWPDWRCYLVAQGMDIDVAAAADRHEHRAASVYTARWNRIPGVRREIEHEREIALGPVKVTAEAWWAKVRRLEAMASGELPMIRTVVEMIPAETGDQGAGEAEPQPPTRRVTVENFYETQLPVLSKAIEMQGKALSVFVDKTELTGPGGGPILTEDAETNRARIAVLLDKARIKPGKPSGEASGG